MKKEEKESEQKTNFYGKFGFFSLHLLTYEKKNIYNISVNGVKEAYNLCFLFAFEVLTSIEH